MTITATSNKGLLQIGVGTESGTWGPYVNATTGLLDNALGTTTTLALTNSNVVLSSAQYQCSFIKLTGALGGNIGITLPAVGSFYTVQNLTTNSSLYQVAMGTAAGGEIIGIPWGESIDIMTDGTNTKFRSLGRVGSYLEIASPTVPAWITTCTVPPYLNCNGQSFSSATYPFLRDYLGSNNVPLCVANVRFNLDDGSGRIGAANPDNPNGNNMFSFGGANSQIVAMAYLPYSNVSIHQISAGAFGSGSGNFGTIETGTNPTAIAKLPPFVVHGITMIRAG